MLFIIKKNAVLALALAALSSTAAAVPATYTISATATGSLDGKSFVDKLITLVATGDTASIVHPTTDFYQVPVTATVSIQDMGSATLIGPLAIYDFQSSANPSAGLTDLSYPRDILDTTDAAFGTYDLSTSIGPITGGVLYNPGTGYATTGGTFVINDVLTSTFQAVVAPVPEPGSMAAFGLGSLAILRRRKR